MSSDPNYQWEDLLYIDDSGLPLTLIFRPCNRHVRETIIITSTQNTDGIVQVEEVEEKPIRIIPSPAGEDKDFNSGSWVGAIEYVKANGGIVSGCTGDIKTFLKSGKLEQVVAIIKSCSLNAFGDLKWCRWEWNVDGKRRNSKIGGKKEMADLELHLCGNVIDQKDLYKFDKEALDLVLKEEARVSRAHEEWLEKCRQQEEKDAEHERHLLDFHETI
uniref:Uncharacterized protein n=1 Tax=Tanacetum cinerariifolium TaxID=118510 RepID=A0A6L2MK15_TANCI|nr:hypothetical protein [Tanacetum cinerariifolium]